MSNEMRLKCLYLGRTTHQGKIMYLQCLTRCNSTCAHCCFAANATGTDMSIDTVKAALKFAAERGDYVTIGGGEPTIHPKFWEIVGLVLASTAFDDVVPHIITNGKRKDIALRLAALAKRGVLGVELSQDEFHDPISPEVVMAFKKKRDPYAFERGDADYRGIRTVERILPVGRAIEENVATEDEGCCCEDLLVDPEGRLWACGCKTIQLGTIWEPNIPEDWHPEWAHSEEAQEWLLSQEPEAMAA